MKRVQIINIFIMILIGLQLFSCMPPVGNRPINKSTTDDDNQINEYDFEGESSLNYFEQASTTTFNYLQLNSDFSDLFFLKGPETHNYIYQGNTSTVNCLVFNLPGSIDNKIFITAAIAKSSYDITDNSVEYYYQIKPSDEITNKAFCQKTGLVDTLSTYFSTSQISYALNTVCPNCTSSTALSSSGTYLYTSAGNFINSVNISYLSLNISQSSTQTVTYPNSCISYSDCDSNMYDCCSEGQCVKNGAIKSGVDLTSAEYLQSLNDLLTDPESYTNYPALYYSCSEYIPPTTGDEITIPSEEANARLQTLKEIYNCTTPLIGEMGVCTQIYTDVAGDGSQTFSTQADDRSFSSTYTGISTLLPSGILPMPNHSIYELIHAGETLYFNRQYSTNLGTTFQISNGNDVLSDSVLISNLNHLPQSSATNSDLKVRYKVDGSCTKINSYLAKCSKYYTQGQNIGEVNDHYPASNYFSLPYYADTNRLVQVKVDNITKMQGLNWDFDFNSGVRVLFSGTGLQVFDTQEVIMTFYVNLSTHPNLMTLRDQALSTLDQMCNCGGSECSLTPQYDSDQNLYDYKCTYPQPDVPTAPVNESINLSSKSIPHKLYEDGSGTHHSEASTSVIQEGLEFNYTNNDYLKPNNLTQYIGFNEIYGTISADLSDAKPPAEILIKKGTTYDIYVNSGTYSTCYLCGTDYHSRLVKLFPASLTSKGAGYTPDPYESSKSDTTTFRDDDLLFGRACFVPATMIPWTHTSTGTNLITQRQARLKAQHFLFANGYQRDWFGFNYGSVIGSFDGVRWFSIGNKRRIRADSNRLYIAINGHFADLTQNTNYNIQVVDSSLTPISNDQITSDFDSDGATCQKYHQCQVDQDCVGALGWDYSCEYISEISTSWPLFDDNGLELPGQSRDIKLVELIGNSSGTPKRCVYRGKGAPCYQSYDISNTDNTFDGSDNPGMHACSNNNYCELFRDVSNKQKFNDRISRYAKSINTLNATENSVYDSFGLGAMIVGRPLDYNGTTEVDSEVQSQLFQNKISSICIPGRNPTNWGTTFITSNYTAPTSSFTGDQVNNLGMTLEELNYFDDEYLSSCPILDSSGNFLKKDENFMYNTIVYNDIVNYAASQSIASNSLQIFEGMLGGGTDIISNFTSSQVSSVTLQENRCLRAPGATCHSDFECAPSKYISTLLTPLNSDDSVWLSVLNKFEIQFWKESLICSQEYTNDSSDFNLKNNRCCRETGKIITIPSYDLESDIYDPDAVPGIDINMTSQKRFSGNSIIYKDLKDGNLNYLRTASNDQCDSGTCEDESLYINQFNTLNTYASKMCCSGNWIRNFHDLNGGGHHWLPAKMQKIDATSFQCLNWQQCTYSPFPDVNQCGGADNTGFSCDHVDTDPTNPRCRAISTSSVQADDLFNWIGRLELLGVPQITIPINGDDYLNIQNIMCNVNPDDQRLFPGATLDTEPDATDMPLPNILNISSWVKGVTTDFEDASEYINGTNYYYSSTDTNNFTNDIKPIFNSQEVTCCVPAGQIVSATDNDTICCSGKKDEDNRCVLEDFTDISVFFNRFVSSATKGLDDSLFDPKTGYFAGATSSAPPSALIRLACQNKVCKSNTLAQGVSLSNLPIRGIDTQNSDNNISRYIDGHDSSNSTGGYSELYDAGLRWNNHLYCVPAELETDGNNIHIYDCEGLY